VPGPRERSLERRHRDPAADDPKHERAAVLDRDDRQEEDARRRAGILLQGELAHATLLASTPIG
jgi:hypothetical protein